MKLELQDLSVVYRPRQSTPRHSEVRAVDHCSFSVSKGNIVGLVGESGSGKSSALMAIPRLLPFGTKVSGQILCDGEDLLALEEGAMNAWRWRRIALVPQGAMNSFTPHLTIGRHISEVLECHMNLSRREANERSLELLQMTGLEGSFLSRYPHELSGGQKQRAAMAAALACNPDFLLADEPTTALDVITQKEILDMIAQLVQERGMGLLLVTHDLPLAAVICDTLVVMKDGQVIEKGLARSLTQDPQQPYTRQLIQAIRSINEAGAGTGADAGGVL